MSTKEVKRRKVSQIVMLEAWRLKRSTGLYQFTFATSLRLAWQIVRCRIKQHWTKVAGTTYQARQKLLQRLLCYNPKRVIIKLVRQPDNPFDEYATLVIAEVKGKGEAVLGYLSSRLAQVIAPLMDKGKQAVVSSFEVTGGGKKLYGCNLNYFLA